MVFSYRGRSRSVEGGAVEIDFASDPGVKTPAAIT
jgi:hypothetical protein